LWPLSRRILSHQVCYFVQSLLLADSAGELVACLGLRGHCEAGLCPFLLFRASAPFLVTGAALMMSWGILIVFLDYRKV